MNVAKLFFIPEVEKVKSLSDMRNVIFVFSMALIHEMKLIKDEDEFLSFGKKALNLLKANFDEHIFEIPLSNLQEVKDRLNNIPKSHYDALWDEDQDKIEKDILSDMIHEGMPIGVNIYSRSYLSEYTKLILQYRLVQMEGYPHEITN